MLSGRMGTESLIILGERMLKVAIVVLAIFTVMGTLGFNLSAPLAGLGIGGIAIAFAAQKTLENLFGGVSILGDEVIRIGDTCRFGDRVGTVADISLRSTRIRTPERTELSIPNGSLATMNVENLSRRDKILFNTKLGLRYETSPDQMRYVLVQVRRLLYEHPKVETEGARSRFVSFDTSALTMEIFCYILTRDDRRVPGDPRRSSASHHGHCGCRRQRLCLPVADRLSGPRHAASTSRKRRRQRRKCRSGATNTSCPSPTSRPPTFPRSAIRCPIPSRVRRSEESKRRPSWARPDFAVGSLLRSLRDFFATSAVKAFNRKGRKENPQRTHEAAQMNVPETLMRWTHSMRPAIYLALLTVVIGVFVPQVHSWEVPMQSSIATPGTRRGNHSFMGERFRGQAGKGTGGKVR